MQRILILFIISILFITSCSKNKKGEDFEPVDLEEITQTGTFKVLWSKELNDGKKAYGYQLIPSIDDDKVYVAGQWGEVMRLSTSNGSTDWNVELGYEISSGPGVGVDILAIGTPEGFVVALDKNTGAEKWNVRLSSEILSPPIVDNNMVIVRAQDGRVYSLNAETGARNWLFDTNMSELTRRGNSIPVVKAGRVYIGFDSGKVAAIKQESGEVIWSQNVIDANGKTELDRLVDIDGDMALIATDLYLSSAVGKTISVATESGRVMWSKDVGSANGVTASRNNLYILDQESNVYALNRTSGTEEWSTSELKYRKTTRPIFYLGDVIVGDIDGYIHVLDGENGEFLARTRLGKSEFYSNVVNDGSLMIAYNKDGTLTAFEYSR
ncbi:MAG: outer membrane protein assembly factor BamB [Marinicellaceae bacterium]